MGNDGHLLGIIPVGFSSVDLVTITVCGLPSMVTVTLQRNT